MSGTWPALPDLIAPTAEGLSGNGLWVVPQSAEKPHETINRALREIAGATRELRESAQALGLCLDREKVLSALIGRLRDAMKD